MMMKIHDIFGPCTECPPSNFEWKSAAVILTNRTTAVLVTCGQQLCCKEFVTSKQRLTQKKMHPPYRHAEIFRENKCVHYASK